MRAGGVTSSQPRVWVLCDSHWLYHLWNVCRSLYSILPSFYLLYRIFKSPPPASQNRSVNKFKMTLSLYLPGKVNTSPPSTRPVYKVYKGRHGKIIFVENLDYFGFWLQDWRNVQHYHFCTLFYYS